MIDESLLEEPPADPDMVDLNDNGIHDDDEGDLLLEPPDDGIDDEDIIDVESVEVATETLGRERLIPPGVGRVLLAKIQRVIHPKTLLRLLAQAARGVPKALSWFYHWRRGDDLQHLLAKGASPAAVLRHDNHVLQRRKATKGAAILLGVAFLASWVAFGLVRTWCGLGTLVFLTLLMFGRDPKRPVLNSTAKAIRPVITDELVRKVIASAVQGIRAEDWQDVRVLHPGVAWLDRNWWQVRVELPGTIEGDAAKKARKKLMSGFGVGMNQLFIEIDPENHGVIIITGTRTNPWNRPPTVTPLLDAESFSVWDPIPVAADGRNRRIAVSLLFTGWVVGALPRMGKTNFARLLACAAALDPWCDLIVFDLKGSTDWTMFRPIARAFGLGNADSTLQHLLSTLKAVEREINRRAELVTSLPIELWSSGQLTRPVAEDPELDLQPIMIFIDEVQWAFGNAKYGRAIATAVENIVKTGAFVGVSMILATQRPDSVSVPTKIRDVLGSRVAFACTTREMSQTILGTQANSEGFNAATLPRQRGIAMLYGADDMSSVVEPAIVQTDHADAAHVMSIVARAETARRALGRLPEQRKKPLPHLWVVGQQAQADRGFVPAQEFWDLMSVQDDGEPWTPERIQEEITRLAAQGKVQRIKMNGRTTGMSDLPEHWKGRTAYKFLTSGDEVATL